MREANARGEALGPSEDELAFYDALGTNDSAVQVLVKRILRKDDHPPDTQKKATRTVLEQAEALSAGWAV